jgi:hypothetical protein
MSELVVLPVVVLLSEPFTESPAATVVHVSVLVVLLLSVALTSSS